MALKSYKFPEEELPTDFCADQISQISKLIKNYPVICIEGLSASGITIFNRFLTTKPLGQFVFVDSSDVTPPDSTHLLKSLLKELGGQSSSDELTQIIDQTRIFLTRLSDHNEKIIIIFNRFDAFYKNLNSELFEILRSLQNVDRQKITMIFGLCRSMDQVILPYIKGAELTYFSNRFFLPLYSQKDTESLLKLYGPFHSVSKTSLKEVFRLSGGHIQLTQLLLQTDYLEQPLSDKFIQLALKDIFDHFNNEQKKQLKAIVQGKKPSSVDEYLLKTTAVRQTNGQFSLFSPLLSDYIVGLTANKLTLKERRLLKLLKIIPGKVVTRDEIFNSVWVENPEAATDWALDALVYRLRKNPKFVSEGYRLENIKKIGYSITKE